MKIKMLAAAILSLFIACNKDNKNNDNPAQQGFGRFTIYGELACPDNSIPVLLAAYNDINSPDNAVSSVTENSTTPENPEFYVKKYHPKVTLCIQAPSGKHLYSGKGLERNTGNCTRGASIFLSNNAPCKEIKEFEKSFDYCFSAKFFFTRKP